MMTSLLWNFRYILLLCSLSPTIGQDLVLECPSAVPTQSNVPAERTLGWSNEYNLCYLPVLTTHLPFDQAQDLCTRYGGRLAEPSGYVLTGAIGDLVTATDSTVTHVWTGYNRIGYAPSFDVTGGYWSDGRSTTVDVGVWAQGEPRAQAGDCAYMSRTSSGWKWSMDTCDRPRPFVCQATPCPEGTFRCDNGRCVSQTLTCNSENNCGDMSDESNCPNSCSYRLSTRQGDITHPTRGAYSNQDTCQWVIEGALGSRLQLEIVTMNTEEGVDFLEVWGGGSSLSSSVLLRRLSGNTTTALATGRIMVSPNNMAVLRFTSDGSNTASGFMMRWKSDFKCNLIKTSGLTMTPGDGNPSSPSTTTEDFCYSNCMNDVTCVAMTFDPNTLSCTRLRDMPQVMAGQSSLLLYVKTCPGIQGRVDVPEVPSASSSLYAAQSESRLYSPLYPIFYPGGQSYVWTVYAPGRTLITVQILDIDLSNQDSLSFYDGATLTSDPILTLTSTSSGQQVIMSTGSSMLIYFRSYTYSDNRGFLLSYKTGCDYSVTSNSGEIMSPGLDTGAYPNMVTCTWDVRAEQGRPLRLSFSRFDLETNKDYVEVYRDNSQTAVHTGQGYTGLTIPPTLQSTDGQVKIVMKTSGTGTRPGFKASFDAGCLAISDPFLSVSPSTAVFSGDRVTITCRDQYVFASPYTGMANVQLTCGQGGQWSPAQLPICIQVLCGRLPTLNNGYPQTVTGVFSGDTASYVCNPGYQLYPDNTPITCTNTGSWSPYPVCFSNVQCKALKAPQHGELQVALGNGRDPGSVIVFLCPTAGYELVGTPVLVCDGGTWSADTPTCQKRRCGVPYIGNATLSATTGVAEGDVIVVTCDPGFQLVGSNAFTCGLTSVFPSCENVDECAQGLSGCQQVCTDTAGSYVCSCRDGYTLQSNGRTCADVNECSTFNGGCDQTCLNTQGSYSCSCTIGSTQLFTYDGQYGIFIAPTETGREDWNVYHLNHTCVQPPGVTCPNLSRTPSNGYLLSDQSSYSPGEQVSYLCELGYQLNGPSTLQCLNSGQWNQSPPTCQPAQCLPPATGTSDVTPTTPISYLDMFTATCTVQGVGSVTLKSTCTYSVTSRGYTASITDLQCPTASDCGQPTRLAGTLPYSVASTSYGSTFQFRCRLPYFSLQGASSLTADENVSCMGDGRWDFGDLRCIDPSCTDPGTLPGTIQDAVSYEEFSIVRYRCERVGFEPSDPRPLQCQWDPLSNRLGWNGTAPTCVDVTPPSFVNCDQREVTIGKLTPSGLNDPSASDNVEVTSFSISPVNHYMSQVVVSDKIVTYRAADSRGNEATCEIAIRVSDEEPPELRCVAPYTISLQSASDVRRVDMNSLVTSYTDNSNSVSLAFTPSSLTIDRTSIGEIHAVKVVASDPSGNTDTCLVYISVTAPTCVNWGLSVDFSQISCVTTALGFQCTVTCNPGYVMYEDPSLSSVVITCSGGAWSRSEPQCVAQRESNHRQSFEFRYLLGVSVNPNCTGEYGSQLQANLNQVITNLNNLCSGNSPVTSVTSSPTNIFVSFQGDWVYASFILDINTSGGFGQAQTEAATNQCASQVRAAFTSVTTDVSPIQRLDSRNGCPSSAIANYQRTIQDGFGCGLNEESYTSGGAQYCIRCPPGHSSQNGVTCFPCQAGTFFDASRQSCQPCPSDARWVNTGARTEMECYLTCPFGYSSSTGSAPCTVCPANTYSSDRQVCTPCPAGRRTAQDGNGLINTCKAPCTPGSFSKDGLEPCSPCPRGFYQSASGAKTCAECSSDETTASLASISASECVPGEPSLCNQFKCQNGGTCKVAGHDYFCICREGNTGRNCETNVSPCASQPCYNQGVCIPTGTTTYRCNCPAQSVTGPNCEVNTNEICNNNPCQNYGGCKTGVANYMCLCPSYSMYTFGVAGFGSECTKLRLPCDAYPCLNGARCEPYGNIRRRCLCQQGYTGDSCELDIDSCLSNPCKNGADCIDGPSGDVTCVCPNGFSGELCEQRVNRCDVTTCPSFANCVDNYETDELVCICQVGFQKDAFGNCVQVVSNVCSPNPCLNSGVCYRDGASYKCFCTPGYEGARCQHNIDDCEPNPCQHGGVCTDVEPPPSSTSGRFTCQCNSDTYGNTCLDGVDICQGASNPCLAGHSRCIDLYRDYFCECEQGYYGKNCTEKGNLQCGSFPCQHGGTCVETGTSYFCQCPDGYTGANCASIVDNCVGNPCLNTGNCVSHNQGYQCACPYGFRGDRCELIFNLCDVANPCQGVGSTCTDAGGAVSCSCGAGYSGPYCQTKDVSCSSTSCENGAVCSETSTGIICSCPRGYAGSRCEQDIDDCLNNNCPAGAQCVDQVDGYICQCLENRVGADCSKVVSSDFDVVLSSATAYQSSDYQRLVQPINRRAFTVSAWVRYTRRSQPATVLSLLGLNSADDFSNPQEILRLESDRAVLEFGSFPTDLTYNADVTDGFWHHVVLTWDSNQGAATVYIDGQQANSVTYGTQQSVRPYGWLVLGGVYDSASGRVDQSGGMTGRVSRVYISDNALSSAEVAGLVADTTQVPNGDISGYTVAMATGSTAPVDHNSDISSGLCFSASNCRSIDSISSNPQFTSCPDDQVLVSPRVATPTWTTPSASSAPGTVVRTTTVSGASEMGWGTMGVAYASLDQEGNADVCTFKVYNRRTACNQPTSVAGTSPRCSSVGGYLRCDAQCPTDQKLTQGAPVYYSCGPGSMFDTGSRVLNFTYPACTACTTPSYDFHLRVNFTVPGSPSCGSSQQIQAQTTLSNNIRDSLTSLSNQWPGLCSAGGCSDVTVSVTCSFTYGTLAEVTFAGLSEYLPKFDGSQTLSVPDLLSESLADDGLFTYAGTAQPDLTSVVINRQSRCPAGTLLVGDCCSECGPGHFYNTDTATCTACPKGSYLATAGTSGSVSSNGCVTCPGGRTTASEGATSSSDCFISCGLGTYYNSQTQTCTNCEVGYYADIEGSVYCSACPYTETTAGSSTTSRLSCSVASLLTTTTQAPPNSTGGSGGTVGASTSEDNSLLWTLLAVLAVILVVIILLLCLLFFCCRSWVEKICPCLVSKVTPEEKSQWHYVNRFGETNLKFVSYRMSEVQGRRSDKESLVSEEDNRSVHTNISLQVPIFEEKLNGSVTKKSVHVAEHTTEEEERQKKKSKRKKRSRSRKRQQEEGGEERDEGMPQSLPPLQRGARGQAPPTATTDEPMERAVRRPPSAFNKPKPKLDQVPYDDFVPSPRPPPLEATPRSFITLDSDDDLR